MDISFLGEMAITQKGLKMRKFLCNDTEVSEVLRSCNRKREKKCMGGEKTRTGQNCVQSPRKIEIVFK